MNANEYECRSCSVGTIIKKYTTRSSEKDKMVEIQFTVNLDIITYC